MGGKGSGGDSTTQKNIFNGNKLPENFIFPKWESPPDLLPPKRQELN